ncbi:transposase [Streptomyces sp. BRA346]|uniref:transposase n=1 Tax=Streptomyces sp. BRA346 TaxID=2878199 RepID=UPI004062FEEB
MPMGCPSHRKYRTMVTHGRFWSGSYFAGSCGGAPLQQVKDYIESQKRPNPTTDRRQDTPR